MITLMISCSITRIQVKGENKETKINSRVFKGYDLETELEYNRFLIQERAITERLEPIKEKEKTLGKKIREIKKGIEYKNLDKETLLKKIEVQVGQPNSFHSLR